MIKSMSVLALIGLVDSISYMAVAPSLIFYVLQVGGSKEQYGLVMSIFSFASFCGKPVFGIWVDRGGNKFRTPYFASFGLAIIGSLMYFFADACKTPFMSLTMIMLGRLLGGFGAANQALGYAYIASVVPQEKQTKTNTVLAMTRILGMATGPIVNIFLGKIDYTLSIGGMDIPVGSLNSVGLLLAAGNVLVVVVIYFLLEEPPDKEKKPPIVGEVVSTTTRAVLHAIGCIEIILPFCILLVVNSSFQLIETALSPAAADALGWGPVETSAVFGGTSIVIFVCMIVTVVLSGKVSDLSLVAFGNFMWIIGGGGMYLLWKQEATAWHFVLPIMLSCTGFPFIASSNRSNFTKAVASKPELESVQALMQSILSMAASVAGFVTPGFVATFVLRSPEEVAASEDLRELTAWALYVPVLLCFVLVGLYYLHLKQEREAQPEDIPANEFTGLVRKNNRGRRSSVISIDQQFSRQSEVARRMSTQMMGLTGFDTKAEKDERTAMQNDLQELIRLSDIDFESGEMN